MIRSNRCRTVFDNFSENWKEEQREFYASWPADQAKQRTKAAAFRNGAPIHGHSRQKNILLSPTPQDFHHSCTAFPQPAFARRASAGNPLTETNRHRTLKPPDEQQMCVAARVGARRGRAAVGRPKRAERHVVSRVSQRRHGRRELR